MRSRQSLLCILAAVVVVITAAGSNAIELVGRATMVQADSIPMGLPGDTVWDFSGVRPLPGSKTWVASKMGDSVLAVACGDSQLTYLERNDSLYWLGFENPSTEMRETGTVRAARPSRMPYSHSHMTPIRFMGRFCGIDSVMLRGVLQSECDAHGAIVLGNDTVADVTRERQQMSSEFSAGGISKGKVSIVRHRWYRAGGYFPVAESLEAEIQAVVPSSFQFYNHYKMSEKGLLPSEITDVKMDKNRGITWRENYFWSKPYNSDNKVSTLWFQQ